VVDSVVRFLQGRDPTVARRIATGSWLPVGPRLEAANPSQLGPHAVLETARLFATLYLEDLADLVTACIDPGFGFARYHHQLALSQQSYDPIAARLDETTLLDTWLD